MGCTASQPAGKESCSKENRREELAKCASISPKIRWSWLRSHTLFTFGELRTLFKIFQTSSASSPQRLSCERSKELQSALVPPPLSTTAEARAASTSHSDIAALGMAVDKSQFLALCYSDEVPRLSEVVGVFGSRLFDILDVNGDGELAFEAFASGLSRLLKGPESEKLKLMYAAYDLSGVIPSEERRKASGGKKSSRSGSSRTSSGSSTRSSGGTGRGGEAGGNSGSGHNDELSAASVGGNGGGGTGGKPKPSRRSKFLTMDDMAAVLASASQGAYPTLLQLTTEGGSNYLSGGGCGNGNDTGNRSTSSPERNRVGESKSPGRDILESTAGELDGGYQGELKEECPSFENGGGGGGGCSSGSSSRGGSLRSSRDPEAVAELLQELARRNAASYAARAISEFGHAQSGALTRKEFEKWALTGPVLRCRINEFSIDVNIAPFQGVQLS